MKLIFGIFPTVVSTIFMSTASNTFMSAVTCATWADMHAVRVHRSDMHEVEFPQL